MVLPSVSGDAGTESIMHAAVLAAVVVALELAAKSLIGWQCGVLFGPKCWVPRDIAREMLAVCDGQGWKVQLLLDVYNSLHPDDPPLVAIWRPGAESSRFMIGTDAAFEFKVRWGEPERALWAEFLGQVREQHGAAVMSPELARVLPLW